MQKIFHSVIALIKRGESYRFGFFASLAVNLCAKALGFFTTILTAFLFGSTAETDLFFFAIASVGIFSSFLINLDGTTIIPRYMKLRDRGEVGQANDLIRFVFIAYFLATAAAAVMICIFPLEWMGLFSRFDKAGLALHRDLIRWTGPLLVISTLNFYLIDIVSSFKRFSLSMLSGFLCNCVNVTFILLAHTPLGIKCIVIGSLLGGLSQCSFLLYCSLRLTGCALRPVVFPLDGTIIRYMLLAQGAYCCSLFGTFLPLYQLSGYAPGVISALGYGQRLVDLLTLLLVVQFSNVLAIKLNELHIGNELEKLRMSFFAIGKSALFFAVPAIMLMSVLCLEVVSVIFQRGEFRYAEALEASRFTRVFVFLIPFLILNTMVARLFMATEKIDKSFGFQSIMGIMTGMICMAGIHFFGPHAYPYALLAAYAFSLLTVKFLLDRCFPWLKGFYRLLFYGLGMLTVNGAIVPLDLMLKGSIREVNPIGIIAVVSCFHLIVFGIVGYLLKWNQPLNETVDRLLKRKKPG
ncbi:MAG: hypothetical protein JW913_02890 [Chitinispirillaceae bacterium]|nr:hypothetical protein [Chitinispirillaceae bacterium]